MHGDPAGLDIFRMFYFYGRGETKTVEYEREKVLSLADLDQAIAEIYEEEVV